jgi:pyridoxamine 5'-phosphate oxidase
VLSYIGAGSYGLGKRRFPLTTLAAVGNWAIAAFWCQLCQLLQGYCALDEQNATIIPDSDPFALFEVWFAEARASEPNDSNAMALATATPEGVPSVRMVLLEGFTFYTNAHSRKGAEIAANGSAALLFHWKSLRRQIRIEGSLAEVDAATADAYFASRSRDSQLGAVASDQSAPLAERAEFLERYATAEAEFGAGPISRPPHWTGFTLTPRALEFWCDRPHRLHDRRRFTRKVDGSWTSTLLYP